MSANIPFDIQEDIIKRVFPVKSLIRFRSVSKQWKSLIDSSEFITQHSVNQTLPHHLLIKQTMYNVDKYISIVDDDSFPRHKFSHAVSPTIQQLTYSSLHGCSNGLVCLLAPSKRLAVFWNPSIRKSIGIVLPDGRYAFGFGVCPKTLDPKIVKISKTVRISHTVEAEVFTLRSRAWRSISVNLRRPFIAMLFSDNTVVIDGVIHWIAINGLFDCHPHHRIVTFDLTNEKFEEVDLPDSLAGRKYARCLDISKLKESLVVLDYYFESEPVCEVWMMLKNGVPKSLFTKLFNVEVWDSNCIYGFRKNGQMVLESVNGELEVYEPGSGHMNGLGIFGLRFQMASYTESLLLLNHPDSITQW